MKILYFRIFLLMIFISSSIYSQSLNRTVSVSNISGSEIIIAVDSLVHETYGLKYPYTYRISIPSGSSGLKAYRKFFSSMNWSQLTEKTGNDFFNGIDAIRFDYENNTAYLSAAFHAATDSLFIKISDNQNSDVQITFNEICKYYDNRDAVVTCSADDWHMSFSNYFIESLTYFRQYNLWVTVGIVTDTGWCNNLTWQQIQTQLNLGYVEAASHSRNHLYVPYGNTEYEVKGSKDDIINNLVLPPQFRKGEKEYVYVWIAPYGQYNDSIDYYVSENQYLTSRLVNEQYFIFSEWEESKNKFAPIGIAFEMGEAYWGGVHNLDSLNNTFNRVLSNREIYHLMFHPHVLNQYNSWNDGYVIAHLEHISNRKNIWYAALGHLYLYHLLKYTSSSYSDNYKNETPINFILEQNYPNPFNPATTIKFYVPVTSFIRLSVYDILGNEINVIVNEELPAGDYSIRWDAGNLPSGVYFYQIKSSNSVLTKKATLIK
jgi:hypothetical protein